MMRPNEFNYQIDKEYKKKIGCDEAKFIFEQAEKSFIDTIETSKKIFERSSALITLLSGIIIGLIAYSIGKLEKNNNIIDSTLVASIAGALYYFSVGLIFVFPNIKPTEYILPGTKPEKYFNDTLFNANPPQGRLTLLYLVEIKNIQDGIDENSEINDKRWKRYRTSLSWIFYSPIVIGIIYILADLVLK